MLEQDRHLPVRVELAGVHGQAMLKPPDAGPVGVAEDVNFASGAFEDSIRAFQVRRRLRVQNLGMWTIADRPRVMTLGLRSSAAPTPVSLIRLRSSSP